MNKKAIINMFLIFVLLIVASASYLFFFKQKYLFNEGCVQVQSNTTENNLSVAQDKISELQNLLSAAQQQQPQDADLKYSNDLCLGNYGYNYSKVKEVYSDDILKISFAYPSYWGNVIATTSNEKYVEKRILTFSEFPLRVFFEASVYNSDFDCSSGSWGDIGYCIKGTNDIKKLCTSNFQNSFDCQTFKNKYGILITKEASKPVTQRLPGNSYWNYEYTYTMYSYQYYFYNPNGQYTGIALSLANIKQRDTFNEINSQFDELVQNIDFTKTDEEVSQYSNNVYSNNFSASGATKQVLGARTEFIATDFDLSKFKNGKYKFFDNGHISFYYPNNITVVSTSDPNSFLVNDGLYFYISTSTIKDFRAGYTDCLTKYTNSTSTDNGFDFDCVGNYSKDELNKILSGKYLVYDDSGPMPPGGASGLDFSKIVGSNILGVSYTNEDYQFLNHYPSDKIFQEQLNYSHRGGSIYDDPIYLNKWKKIIADHNEVNDVINGLKAIAESLQIK